MTLLQIGNKINEAIKDRMKVQGHHLRGGIENSLRLEETGNEITCYAAHYAEFVNNGVPAAKIPYSPGSGKKKSDYISGLQEYAKARKMADTDEEALSIAFAIAKKHKKNGMPTGGSWGWSRNGKRTGFISDVLKEMQPTIKADITQGFRVTIKDKLR